MFFGTLEVAWLAEKDLCSWSQGLSNKLWNKGKKREAFVLAVQQVLQNLVLRVSTSITTQSCCTTVCCQSLLCNVPAVPRLVCWDCPVPAPVAV